MKKWFFAIMLIFLQQIFFLLSEEQQLSGSSTNLIYWTVGVGTLKISDKAKKYNLKIIEDSCETMFAHYKRT